MAESLPTLYAAIADMQSIFTVNGVQWRLDDDNDDSLDATELQYLEDLLREATDVVNEYALHYYEAEQLAESRIVQRWTAWIACYLLARRRGNPAQFADEYESILVQLREVSKGLRWIPRITPRANFRPQVQNYTLRPTGCGGWRCQAPVVDDSPDCC